tara:strand:- start:202 stop:906 length:705 start_codon:yes stop_codon:yes gene_type:complete
MVQKSVEGINISEMGWATDFFLAINILLLSNELTKNSKIKLYFLNIAAAYFLGGITHKYYGNKAKDGVGQVVAYILLTAGYLLMTIGHFLISNNNIIKYIMIITQIIQISLACVTIYYMKKVQTITDNKEPSDNMTQKEKKAIQFDYYYGVFEIALVILYSIVVFNYSYSNYKDSTNILIFCFFNIIGYVLVYGVEILSIFKIIPPSQKRQDYNQLIFHILVNISMFYLYKHHK